MPPCTHTASWATLAVDTLKSGATLSVDATADRLLAIGAGGNYAKGNYGIYLLDAKNSTEEQIFVFVNLTSSGAALSIDALEAGTALSVDAGTDGGLSSGAGGDEGGAAADVAGDALVVDGAEAIEALAQRGTAVGARLAARTAEAVLASEAGAALAVDAASHGRLTRRACCSLSNAHCSAVRGKECQTWNSLAENCEGQQRLVARWQVKPAPHCPLMQAPTAVRPSGQRTGYNAQAFIFIIRLFILAVVRYHTVTYMYLYK